LAALNLFNHLVKIFIPMRFLGLRRVSSVRLPVCPSVSAVCIVFC